MSLGQRVQTGYDTLVNPVILTLSKAWLGIGVIKPASTDGSSLIAQPAWLRNVNTKFKSAQSDTQNIQRFDYKQMYYLKIGDYFMPISQTFTVAANKRTNVSSLVDGIDFIQQTRKEAKTIDCSLRMTIDESKLNLNIVDADSSVMQLSAFLNSFYENDAILKIENDMINNVFNVQYVFLSKYKFTPKVGSRTFMMDFSLTEISFGENVLTFDANEVNSDTTTKTQIR